MVKNEPGAWNQEPGWTKIVNELLQNDGSSQRIQEQGIFIDI